MSTAAIGQDAVRTSGRSDITMGATPGVEFVSLISSRRLGAAYDHIDGPPRPVDATVHLIIRDDQRRAVREQGVANRPSNDPEVEQRVAERGGIDVWSELNGPDPHGASSTDDMLAVDQAEQTLPQPLTDALGSVEKTFGFDDVEIGHCGHRGQRVPAVGVPVLEDEIRICLKGAAHGRPDQHATEG